MEAGRLRLLAIDVLGRTQQAMVIPDGILFNGFVGRGEHTVVITVLDEAVAVLSIAVLWRSGILWSR